MKNDEKKSLETLNEKSDFKHIQDLPTTFFKPIAEVQSQQTEMLNEYQKQVQKDMPSNTFPDLSNEVRMLEKKLAAKKNSLPFFAVLLLVLFINICWFLGVHFLIVPKYENYVEQSNEIQDNYDSLKRKVDAIVGSD